MQSELSFSYKLCKICGIFPDYNFNTNILRVQKFKTIILVIIVNVLNISSKCRTWNTFHPSKKVLDIMAAFTVFFGILHCMWTVNFKKTEYLQKLFTNLNEVKNKLHLYHPKPYANQNISVYIAHIILILFLSTDMYYWLPITHLKQHILIMTYELLIYINFMIVILQITILCAIKKRYSIFNQVLDKIDHSEVLVEDLLTTYQYLSDSSDCFNELFGGNMLCTCLQGIMNVLSAVSLMININDVPFVVFGVMIIWTAYFLVNKS